MLYSYSETSILAVLLGLIGGLLAHAQWLLKFGKSQAQSGKTPSTGKKAKNLRIGLMVLSMVIVAAAGFIVAFFAALLPHRTSTTNVRFLRISASSRNKFSCSYNPKITLKCSATTR